ncbi:MAG: DUF86 domain-containing protein [Candidatus Kerfeldbacteria bacterium]|nr:DUF86 domain-containing protein [Candidatus Kerfeldbacteria bacterium]
MDRDSIYLEEIKEFCRKVIGFTAGSGYEQFVGDEKLQLAVVKLIENIGEASKRLSPAARSQYSAVDWTKAAAMRDRLVHDYMDVDLAIVFDVATHEVPLLLKSLQ